MERLTIGATKRWPEAETGSDLVLGLLELSHLFRGPWMKTEESKYPSFLKCVVGHLVKWVFQSKQMRGMERG
jgi:hypothetical protein